MHIVALVLAVLAGGAIWYWRIKTAATAVNEIGDAAGRLKGAYNRRKFRKKVEASTLTGIEDPKQAAAVLLVSMVEAGRRMTQGDEEFVLAWLRDVAKERSPEEALTFARWASREVIDVNEVIRRLAPRFNAKLDVSERDQLVASATTLVRFGSEEAAQTGALKLVRSKLLAELPREAKTQRG